MKISECNNQYGNDLKRDFFQYEQNQLMDIFIIQAIFYDTKIDILVQHYGREKVHISKIAIKEK